MKKPRIEINSYYGIISVRAFSDGKKYVLENEMLIRFLEKKLKKGEYTLEKGRERRNYKWSDIINNLTLKQNYGSMYKPKTRAI